MSLSTLDAIIVGGGPAGLAAALALGRINRTAVVFDSGVYRNANATEMHTVPLSDGRGPDNYRKTARQELTQYPTIRVVDRKIENIERSDKDGRFRATDGSQEKWTSKKLILATGSKDILPDIKGFSDRWGKEIGHCVFCHGYEHREKTWGAFGYNFFSVSNAFNAVKLNAKVTLFTNGVKLEDAKEIREQVEKAMPGAHLALCKSGVTYEERRIVAMNKLAPGSLKDQTSDEGVELVFEDGQTARVHTIMHMPQTQQASGLAKSLGVDLDEKDDVKPGTMFGETNVSGVFVAGDAGMMLKSVPVAINTGVMAGVGIHHSLLFDEVKQLGGNM